MSMFAMSIMCINIGRTARSSPHNLLHTGTHSHIDCAGRSLEQCSALDRVVGYTHSRLRNLDTQGCAGNGECLQKEAQLQQKH